MYENYYHEQLAKISTCVKNSIDAYDRYILPRYTLSFCFRNLNSRDYHGDYLNVMFPRPNLFPTVSPGISACFSWCFYRFLRCFPCFPAVFPVSYFRFCEYTQFFNKVKTIVLILNLLTC